MTVKGNPETADLGHELVDAIRHVQGVVAVRDELAYPPPSASIRRACTSDPQAQGATA